MACFSMFVCMYQFCEDYTEIEKKLERKGVVLREKISLLPPDVQYAQVINMSDYDMKQDAELIAVNRRRIRKGNTANRSEG